ncbi:MAG: long-chain-fatty-acid--CoA ligase [Desulfobacterales bacterium]|nr:long-chain-fatty-acid--CoA ligase [Desulfobacterales bacterium]MBF0395527.1 long-chain-fatty-acid--CoA ligase [Desulfobacterales bacterium]
MEKIWLKSYDKGVPEEIDLNRYESIPHILDEVFKQYGNLPAFHNMGKTITYSDLENMSKKFGSYLQNELKLQKGDRVALMMPNILQYPIALFGILQAGMIAVNVNPLYTARELEHQLKDSGAKAIVIFANSAHILQKILDKVPIKHVIVTQIGDLLGFPKSFIVNFVIKYIKKMVPKWEIPSAICLKSALCKGDASTFKPVKTTLDDIAFLQYTGGTTGVAKGAMLTHGNIVANVLQAKSWINNLIESGKEIMITPLPLYHIFSLTANCLVFSSIGSLNILITNPRDIPNFVKELKKCKFTSMTGVNTLYNALLNNQEFKNLNFKTLKLALGGGMAVQKPVAEAWKKVTSTPLIEAYGLTETSPAACMNPMTLKEFNGYVGLPIPSTIVSIKDDNGKDLPIGEIGEICIKGPQVMKGYWNRPDETAKVMTEDGFFRTGDIGFMNDGGFVKIVDRKKDMILVSGFNVYPNEIEEVVVSHPKVLECAAIGVSDAKSGEAVKLFVVKKEASLTEEELLGFCRENLTGYKIPKYVVFKDELPKSNVGKILRKDLRGQ